ncbi:MAG: ABC transporter permease [Bacteroidales bacterium]
MIKISSIYAFQQVFLRECRRLVSKPIYLFSIIVAPLFCYFFFTSLMKNGLPTNLPIAVVDLDKTSTSRNTVRQLDAFPQTEVVMNASNFAEARTQLQEGSVYAVFVIPHHFMRDILNGVQPKITFYTNNTYFIAGALVFRDMKTVSVLMSGAVGRQVGLAKGQNPKQLLAQLQPIVVDAHPIGNPWLNYSVYLNNMLLPGILQLMIILLTVYSIGIEIKEQTAKQWLAVSNNSILIATFGKLLPQTLLFSMMGILFQILLYGYLHFPLNSGLMPMLFAVLLFVISAQSLGVFMISVLPTLRLGMSFASLIGVISFSIAGFSYPVFAMHPSLQWVSHLFPLRHYFLIYVDQALNGYSLYYSRMEYMALMLFVLAPIPLAYRLKHSLKHREYKM